MVCLHDSLVTIGSHAILRVPMKGISMTDLIKIAGKRGELSQKCMAKNSKSDN